MKFYCFNLTVTHGEGGGFWKSRNLHDASGKGSIPPSSIFYLLINNSCSSAVSLAKKILLMKDFWRRQSKKTQKVGWNHFHSNVHINLFVDLTEFSSRWLTFEEFHYLWEQVLNFLPQYKPTESFRRKKELRIWTPKRDFGTTLFFSCSTCSDRKSL